MLIPLLHCELTMRIPLPLHPPMTRIPMMRIPRIPEEGFGMSGLGREVPERPALFPE